jgi:hypothetical protein
MVEKVRHQLFLPRPTSERLEALAAKPGLSKSTILADAVTAWLDRRGRSELDDRFGLRLDGMTRLLDRLERDSHILLETSALFIRYELMINPPLAESDQAGRAAGSKRFEAFLVQVARAVATGRRTFQPGDGQ